MPTTQTNRAEKLLEVLNHRVPVMTLEQVAGTWWSDTMHPVRHVHSIASRLDEHGSLFLHTVQIPPLPRMCADSGT